MAWGNMKRSLRTSPKQLLSRKNARVSASFASLVMMYHGIVTPYFCCAARICSAKHRKSGLPVTGVAGYVPFGPFHPSRVPCPPATVKAAILPARIASSPTARYRARSSGDRSSP